MFGVHACKGPLEGVSIKLKDPLSESTVKISYINANGDTTKLNKKLIIKIIGPDAAQVLSSVGNDRISISKEGLLGLAINPAYKTRPVKFSVVAEANGYLTTVEDFVLNGTENNERSSRIYKLDQLPSGIKIGVTKVNISSAVTALFAVATTSARMDIPEGAILKNESGVGLVGNLSVILTEFDNSFKWLAPNAYTVYNAISLDNKVLKPFEFNTFNFFRLEALNDKYEKLTSLSVPATVKITINDNVLSITGKKLKVGDKLPFWGHINGVWKQLAEATLALNSANKLEATVSVTQATYYAFGEQIEVCEKGPIFTFTNKANNLDIVYYGRLIEQTSGNKNQVGDLYIDVNNGATTYLAGRRPNTVSLQLFNYNNQYGGNLSKPVYQSEPFDLCTEKNFKVDLSTVLPQPQSVTIELVIDCAAGKVVNEEQLPAELKVQYQPKGAAENDYRDLITLTRSNRKAITYKLNLGNVYTIRASNNPAQGWIFYQRDTTIRQSYYSIHLGNPQYCK